jgi:hypothetical protein
MLYYNNQGCFKKAVLASIVAFCTLDMGFFLPNLQKPAYGILLVYLQVMQLSFEKALINHVSFVRDFYV